MNPQSSPPLTASDRKSTLHVDVSSSGSFVDDKDEKRPLMSPGHPDCLLKMASAQLPVKTTMDLDDYFSGPLDPTKHSKLPYFVRLHGSILPNMVIPIFFVAVWATTVTLISERVFTLSVDSVLLTVLGFVVGLSLSFRSSTAYERYIEGRKFWQLLILHSRNLGRIIWIHAKEREDEEEGKTDLLGKLSAINLIIAFAHAVKHKLRHEIEYDYHDIKSLINHLNTFAKTAQKNHPPAQPPNAMLTRVMTWGANFGIPFCKINPHRAVKQAARQGKHHGNLPFEIMTYIGTAIEHLLVSAPESSAPCWHSQAAGSQLSMMDAYGGCERVLQTPLPLAYSIAISQITWLYVLILPFQLYPKLGWVTIPGTVFAAYIILGIDAIGHEIENPFGRDVNDLDLDRYCAGLQMDMNVLVSKPPPKPEDWIEQDDNLPLWPYSLSGHNSWKSRSVGDIRKALAGKLDHQAIIHKNKIDSSVRVGDGENNTTSV